MNSDSRCGHCAYLERNNYRTGSKGETCVWCSEMRHYVGLTDRPCRHFIEDPSKVPTNSGGCFLTTACMKHMNEDFDDNCEELQVLRLFRDNYVPQEDIDHYYEIAPIIVNILDNSEEGPAIYEFLYNDVIKVCVSDIKQGKIGEAYAIYKNTMIYLEEKFAKPYLQEQFVLTLKKVRNVQAQAY